ncbi:hypothetical protein [Alicyclobacillus fodiniaquatilis]|uniref:Uncharacterized protein n=1 Tax=Alicyclobacillus fodiniaquatilis TaxID=1661150 RepID=A0ABW4JCT7_9BACL
MSMLNNVTTVRGYAVFLGLDPTDRSVLRKIQRQCERGDLVAKLDQGAWLIQISQNNEGAIIMKNWENMKEVYFDGMTLEHAGYGNDNNYGLNNNKVALFYVNLVPKNETPNHFAVTWDFNEFLASEKAGTFEWPTPHAVMPITEERKQTVIDYFSGKDFVSYGREVEFNSIKLTLINRPVEFAKSVGSLRYYAGATDHEGNVYQVYWNVFNMFDPSEIEMTVDNSRYCKHCLQRWTSSADNSKCNHEWIEDLG